MNTATNDTKSQNQNQSKGAMPKNNNRGAGYSANEDTDVQGENRKRGAGDSSTSTSAKSHRGSERNLDESGNVTSLREGGSAKGSREEGGEGEQRQASGSDDKASGEKTSTFFEQLDLALVDASVSVGDIVKKIDALAPKDGGLARVSKYAIGKLQGVESYLGDNGSKDILSGAWQVVRRSPWPVGLALVGAGVGFYIQKNGFKATSTQKTSGNKKHMGEGQEGRLEGGRQSEEQPSGHQQSGRAQGGKQQVAGARH